MPHQIERGRRAPGSTAVRIALVVAVVLLLFGARSIASYAIEMAWWKELGQFRTWLSMLAYSFAPTTAATLVAFAVLWIAHARALKFAGTGLGEHRLYARISALVLLLLGYLISAASIDTWTVVRFAGSRGLPAATAAWHDAVFDKPLSFYLFDLPFYGLLRGYVLALVIFCILLYWVAARGWQLRYRFPEIQEPREIDARFFRLEGGLESRFLRGAAVVLLMALALRFFLGRYEMVYNEHGSFLVGIDWVDERVGLPMQWLMILACFAAAVLVWMRRWIAAACMALALVVAFVVPAAVSALYVRPNEISLERPYIQTHIHATRSAYGIEQRVTEIEFAAQPEAPIDVAANKPLLDNVRLWEWRAFHDTITQRQALRTYYTFHDSDVDRYMIDGQYRQVLLAPRELDMRQLPDAVSNWINPAFIYTHGYGLVLAEVSQMTPDGLPVLLIENAPPEVKTKSLKLTRPEIYYGEVTHEPVFVHTAQQEFDYPSGEKYQQTRYEGTGGFPISSFWMRLAAALREGEPKILLTGFLTENSRMMIRRKVRDRLQTLAGFLQWDTDPYLVITDAGRLVWMVDGYTTSDAHPYSRAVQLGDGGDVNYIRNAVKATVDAYDGETHLYVFAPDDPIIAAYRKLFPDLFRPASEMPADLRAHARYPETLFRVQAEIYRTYHMLDPQSFYNKEDVWDLALTSSGQDSGTEPVTPTYVMATMPGESKPEFLLLIPVYAAQQEQPDRADGLALRRRAPGRNRGAAALQAAVDPGSHERVGQHQPGPDHLQGPDAVEPAGFARAARADPGAAGGQYVPVRGPDLHPGHRGQHAAVEEDRAGGGQPADLRGHLRGGAGAVVGGSAAVDPAGQCGGPPAGPRRGSGGRCPRFIGRAHPEHPRAPAPLPRPGRPGPLGRSGQGTGGD